MKYLDSWKASLQANGIKNGLHRLPFGFWSETDMQSHLTERLRKELNESLDVVNEVYLGNTFEDSKELFQHIRMLGVEERFAPDIVVAARDRETFPLIAELKFNPSLSVSNQCSSQTKRILSWIVKYLVDVKAVSRAVEVGIATVGYFGVIEDRFFDDAGISFRKRFEEEVRESYSNVNLRIFGLSLRTKKATA